MSSAYTDIINRNINFVKAESISSGSEGVFDLDGVVEDGGRGNTYKERNKMIIIFPWKCPRTDSRKVTCIVALPSGIAPENVEFKFLGGSRFQSNAFMLTYEWPEKMLLPETIFKVDMRDDSSFCHKNEFVEFREAARKIRAMSNSSHPTSALTVNLPFMVQRSAQSFTKDLRRFASSNSAILSRDRSKDEFTSLKAMVKCTTSSDHKVYFMILRFTGVEVEEEDKVDKRSRCVQDCDDSSLSDSEIKHTSNKKHAHDDLIKSDNYYQSINSSVYVPSRRKRKRT